MQMSILGVPNFAAKSSSPEGDSPKAISQRRFNFLHGHRKYSSAARADARDFFGECKIGKENRKYSSAARADARDDVKHVV